MVKVKVFHVYTDRTDNDDQVSPAESFHVISKSWAYGGGCGGEGAGMEMFPHMLAALHSQLGWLYDYKGHFSENEFAQLSQPLQETIDKIESQGTDEGVMPSMLSAYGGRVGYETLASGYWGEFIPQALSKFADDLECRIANEQKDGRDEEYIKSLRDELKAIRRLENRKNILRRDFIVAFLKAGSKYEERHC